MKIIPGIIPVTLDKTILRGVESIELVTAPGSDRVDMFAIITVKIKSAISSNEKVEIESRV